MFAFIFGIIVGAAIEYRFYPIERVFSFFADRDL